MRIMLFNHYVGESGGQKCRVRMLSSWEDKVFRQFTAGKPLPLMAIALVCAVDPPPPGGWHYPADCRWISGNETESGSLRAAKGEVVLIKFSVKNMEKPKKIYIVVRPDPRPDIFVSGGLRVIEAPCFAKDHFAVGEIQTCTMKVLVNHDKKQIMNIYFTDDSHRIDEGFYYAKAGVIFNDFSSKKSSIIPWNESALFVY